MPPETPDAPPADTDPAGPWLFGCVLLGGALGGALRWLLTEVFPDPGGIPWTTFSINVLGATALAVVPLLLAGTHPGAPAGQHRHLLAAFLGPGLLGGFTTLSAYATLARAQVAGGDWLETGWMLGGTLAVSLAAIHLVRRRERSALTGTPA